MLDWWEKLGVKPQSTLPPTALSSAIFYWRQFHKTQRCLGNTKWLLWLNRNCFTITPTKTQDGTHIPKGPNLDGLKHSRVNKRVCEVKKNANCNAGHHCVIHQKSTLTLGHKQFLLVPVVFSTLSQCPDPQRRRRATGATMTPACCRGIWAGASLACLRLVYGLWEAGSAASDSCWTCLVVNLTTTFYLLIVTLGPSSFIRKRAKFELTTDNPDRHIPPVLLRIFFLYKKRVDGANVAVSLLSISVPGPDSYPWSSERIVCSCRNVFNSVEDVLICHQVCFSLERS